MKELGWRGDQTEYDFSGEYSGVWDVDQLRILSLSASDSMNEQVGSGLLLTNVVDLFYCLLPL